MEPYKMPEVTRAIGSIPVVQCPRCGADTNIHYVDDTEWDKEQFACKDCGQEFVVGFEREIQYIWWEDAEGKQHEVWDETMLVDSQAHELRRICEAIHVSSGGKRPEGIDEDSWSRLCNAMNAIKHARSHPVHTFDVKGFLKAEFLGRDDEYWGVVYHEPEGFSEFTRSGYSGVTCTGYAFEIRRKLGGRAMIWGFPDDAGLGINYLGVGHDFAVVDDRYIVDPWLIEVEQGRIATPSGEVIEVKGQGVFDLQDPADRILIHAIYGTREHWERCEQIEKRADEGHAKGGSK